MVGTDDEFSASSEPDPINRYRVRVPYTTMRNIYIKSVRPFTEIPAIMYQEEREEHVNVKNVVELESNTEEKPKKTRATRKRSMYCSDTRIHGTSTLRGHLKICDKFPGNMLDGQTQLSIQKGDSDDRKMIAWKFDQQSIRRSLAYMLIVDELPFRFVEGKGFKHFLNATQPLFHTPSRITMARDCMKLYLKEKKKVGVLIRGNVGGGDVLAKMRKFANWEKSVLEGKWLHVRCTAHVAEIEKCPSTKSLILDVPTRWNSTYLMLDAAQKYERAFARYDSEDRHYRDDLEKTGVPISFDWVNVRRLTMFLEHFYELTLKVSGTLYVTSNSFLDDITSIYAALNNCINGVPNANLAAMAKMKKCKFDKYYGSLEKCNMATVVAFVLDPRNNFEYVEVLLGDVYGKIEGKAMCAMIKASLVEFYEDYVRIHASPETHTMFESVDASSSMNKRSATTTPVIEPSAILKQKVRMEMKRRKSENGLQDSKSEDVLAIPISTVASESVFSTGGRVLDAFRSSLTPPVVESLICTEDWFRKNSMLLDVKIGMRYKRLKRSL
ncbi:zinc finger BED domain-containing protein RICESLEEPER 2-like protein [Tanacetum coccineum]